MKRLLITLLDLKHFQDFLYRNFKKHAQYDKMYPSSNQPAKFYGTVKTQKFNDNNLITKSNLNFRPIVAQIGTCYYKTVQIISDYLHL